MLEEFRVMKMTALSTYSAKPFHPVVGHYPLKAQQGHAAKYWEIKRRRFRAATIISGSSSRDRCRPATMLVRGVYTQGTE